MFAVPGWNVSAKKIVQEQVKGNKEKSAKQGNVNSTFNTGSKKRKRSNKDNGFGRKGPKDQLKTGSNNIELGTKRVRTDDGQPASVAQALQPESHSAAEAPRVQRPRKDKKKDRKEHRKSHGSDGQREERAELNDLSKDSVSTEATGATVSLPPSPPPANTKLTPLQAKMRSKLTSARFRHLNETLYTTSSTSAMDLFTNSPDLFTEYHAGFSQQVKDSWPQNPVETYIKSLRTRGASNQPNSSFAQSPLPRRTRPNNVCTIIDLGCGDAPLARALQSHKKKFNLNILSYDLHTPNELVTKADISSLPLRDGEADIAIFCLSLMGTNWLNFVEEAWRVLRGDGKGEVWVAEVKSRFGRVTKGGKGKVVENSVGKRRKDAAKQTKRQQEEEEERKDRFVEEERDDEAQTKNDETDISAFVDVFQRRGFALREGSVDKSNKMFVSMVFMKAGVPSAGKYKDMKYNGKEYVRMERKGSQKRFIDGRGNDDELDSGEEAKVLKPCVYKTR